MDNNGPGIIGVGGRRVLDEGDEGKRVQGNSVIGPGREVVLVDGALGRSLGSLGRHQVALLSARRSHRSDGKGPERVGCQDVLAQQAHHQVPVGL